MGEALPALPGVKVRPVVLLRIPVKQLLTAELGGSGWRVELVGEKVRIASKDARLIPPRRFSPAPRTYLATPSQFWRQTREILRRTFGGTTPGSVVPSGAVQL